MTTKTEINKALAEIGFSAISAKKGDSYGAGKVSLKCGKGICAANIGPMTCTNVHVDRVTKVKENVYRALYELGLEQAGAFQFIVSENSRSVTKIKISSTQKNTYTNDADLDASYQSIWVTVEYVKEAK